MLKYEESYMNYIIYDTIPGASSKRSVDKNPFLAKLGLDPIILETPIAAWMHKYSNPP